MIVPFLISMDEFGKQYPTYLWTFYKFMDFARKNKCPVIAQEKFFNDEYENHNAKTEESQNIFDYQLPSTEQIEKNKKYSILEEELSRISQKYKSKEDAWQQILKSSDCNLESIIADRIKKIEEDYQEKIDAFFTWIWIPSLESISKKLGKRVIFFEYSTIRIPRHTESIGYFQFCDKYKSEYVISDFEEFKKCDDRILFNRRELLALFLTSNALDNIKFLYNIPEYKVGYALGLKDDKFESAFSKYSVGQVIDNLKSIFDKNEVLVRPHPQSMSENNIYFDIDNSPRTEEWISKCESIISNISNVAYEAMLYDRKVINLNKGMPSSFGEESNVEYFNEKSYGLDELNYLTFACYSPYDLMFNKEYIMWRLSNPTITEIYNRNLNYILEKKSLNIDRLKMMKLKERFRYILKIVHNIDENYINEIEKYSKMSIKENYEKNISNLNEIIVNLRHDIENEKQNNYALKEEVDSKCGNIEKLTKEINSLTKEMDDIKESKGWKFLNKLRRIKNKISF